MLINAQQAAAYYDAEKSSGAYATIDAYLADVVDILRPVIGAVFFILIREQLAITLGSAHQIIFGVLFIIVVLVFAGGLAEGWSRLWHGWHRRMPATSAAVGDDR